MLTVFGWVNAHYRSFIQSFIKDSAELRMSVQRFFFSLIMFSFWALRLSFFFSFICLREGPGVYSMCVSFLFFIFNWVYFVFVDAISTFIFERIFTELSHFLSIRRPK